MNLLEILLDTINNGMYEYFSSHDSYILYGFGPVKINIEINISEEELLDMVNKCLITRQDAEIFLSNKLEIEQKLAEVGNNGRKNEISSRQLIFSIVFTLREYNFSDSFIKFVVEQVEI